MSVPVEVTRRVNQLRHDVDDVYKLLDSTNQSVTAIAATQRRHSTRLEEIQQSLDVTVAKLDRLDQAQQSLAEQQQSMAGELQGLTERQQSMAGGLQVLAEAQQRLTDVQQEQGTKLDTILTLLRGDQAPDRN